MMRLAPLAGALVLGWMVAGCATTGDPRQGGLFGWSEAKARERQAERKSRVAGAEAELAGVNTQGRALEARETATGRDLTVAQQENKRAEENLRAVQTTLVAKTERLENESPTSAGASRARAWRVKVNTVAAQNALPTGQRRARLRDLEVEIDAALEKLNR